MLVNLSLSPGYRMKITRASRMSELADRVITAIAAVGGSAAWRFCAFGSSAARTSARSSSSSTSGSWKRATPYARRPTSASGKPSRPSPKSESAATRPSSPPWKPRWKPSSKP
jgi:hypothetical protein